MKLFTPQTLLMCAALTCIPSICPAPKTSAAQLISHDKPAKNELLRQELLRMRAEDQAVRQRWIERKYDAEVAREMTVLDAKHTARLRAIYKKYGFPGVRLVGRDGADAARTMMLHSPSVAFQKESLVYLERAAKRREAPYHDVATLTDKILTAEGKLQLYGTQFDLHDGKLILKPVADPARLEQRRARMGLMPMAEYVRELEEMYKMPAASAPVQTPRP